MLWRLSAPTLRGAVCAVFILLPGCWGASAQATVPVLMLSDLHFDPVHDPAKAARLATTPVAEWDAILKAPPSEHQGESFAAVQSACGARGVDTDFALLQASLKAAKERAQGIAFVTVTGDLLAHDFACRYDFAMGRKHAAGYADFAEKTAVYVMQRVEAEFPGIPIYFAGGNNDSSCGDYRMDPQDRFLKATGKVAIDGLRTVSETEAKAALADYEAGGYFAVTLRTPERMRLLVLDDIYLSARYATCAGKPDGAGADAELAWLGRELSEAKARGEAVWVIGHIPPGIDAYSTLSKRADVCDGEKVTMFLGSDRLVELLEKHANVIKLAVFAHTHSDEMRLLKGDGGSVPVKLVGSISPVNGNRPTFTLAQVDRKTATLTDYGVFVASNSSGQDTSWNLEYDFRETYKEPDLSAAAVGELVGRLQADKAGATAASRAYEMYFAPGMLPILSLVWPQYGCALDHATEAGFRQCVCSEQKPTTGSPAQ